MENANFIMIRISGTRKAALKAVAAAAGETLTTFLLKGAMDRASKLNGKRSEDPFVTAMRRAASGHGADLTAEERNAVLAGRRAAAEGKPMLSAKDLRASFRAWKEGR